MRAAGAVFALISVIFASVLGPGVRAMPEMNVALSDPKEDAFIMNGTSPAKIVPWLNVKGNADIDIRRAGSALYDRKITLFMQLWGNVSQNARYYFLARTTGSGSIWGLYDFVVEFTNASTRIYFATSASYQNLSDAKSFDMNASSTRKQSDLYADVQIDLLRNPPSFQLMAVAFMPRNSTTSYADWTQDAKAEGDDQSDLGLWLWPMVFVGFFLLIITYLSMKGSEGREKDTIACKTCGRRFSKDLLFCPTCGRDAEEKKKR
jgi:hypothetical protein